MLTRLVMVVALAAPPSAESVPPPMTLAEAVALAHAGSPLMKTARAQLDGARTGAKFAGRIPNPSFLFQTENLGHQTGATGMSGLGLDVFAVVTQPIELGGKRSARIDLAGANVGLAEASLGSVERQLTLATVTSYVEALRARETIEVLTTNIEELSALVRTMALRVAEGFTPEADLEKFRTEESRLRVRLARVQLDLRRASATLGVLVGSSQTVDSRRLVVPPPLAPPEGDPATLAERAWESRPEVLVARARLERAQHALALEKARRVPDPALAGGYKRTGGENTGVLGVAIPIPVFNRNGTGIALAEAEERAASIDLEGVKTSVRMETIVLVENARHLAEQAEHADEELLQPAEVVREAARVAFREGAAEVLSLVDAERVYSDVRRETLDLRLDAFLGAIEARLAIGMEPIP